MRGRQSFEQPPIYESIPEGVEVIHGDSTKARLPIFGNRTEMASRADGMASRASARLSRPGTQARLEIDELEMLLKQKAKGSYHEMKKRFCDNDPEGKGNVSREAFARIIITILGRPLSNSQFNRLMDRLGFKDKNIVSFPDFFALFRDSATSEYPRWMDPIQRSDKVTMTASQVHAQLKERAKQRFLDLADLIPQSNPGGTGRLLKPEFRNALAKMLYFMDEDEFEKLWAKYDAEGNGTIDGSKLLQKLGIDINRNADSPIPAGRKSPKAKKPKLSPRKKETDRQRSLNIEEWLKVKFREGCTNMKKGFETFDKTNTGMVSHSNFLKVLAEFGLSLEKSHLDEFLNRCGVTPQKEGVAYREFLHRFQDRSEAGMPHTILTNPKHRYNQSRAGSPGAKSTISALETQLMNMFQSDFLALLGTFHKIDRQGTDLISQEEFRAAIESRFHLEMTDAQFRSLVDRLPLSEDGSVKYAEFMAQFDTKGKAKSLFEAKAKDAPTQETVLPLNVDRLVLDPPVDVDPEVERLHQRPVAMCQKLIKELLARRFQEVEEAFFELDYTNSQRMSQEMFYQLMKQFDIEPELSRGEIRELWKTFILNSKKTLDYAEFVRKFGHSASSAAFPNAKISPPKKGDSDFMVRSRKLNCAADMLQDGLRSKIDYMWEDLRREFIEMDPYGTGFVSTAEFRDVLQELCIHLSDYELQMLTNKFEIKKDGRVSYIEFLKPFAIKKQTWRHGNNMLSLLQHANPELPIADIVEGPQKGLTGITAKLRQKITGDWKNLRRAFKKMDTQNEGYLSLPEFRKVLSLANVILDEDEVYHVMTKFDENMTGKISYNRFLNETFRPAVQK